MARIELICGRVCSGKTTYARDLARQETAVMLSCDEAVRAMEEALCDDYAFALETVKAYLLKKAADVAACGVNVILDWGFWPRKERRDVSAYFAARHTAYRWHYMDVSPEEWERRIALRNAAVAAGMAEEYIVDDGLRAKLQAQFEAPDETEMDVWIRA